MDTINNKTNIVKLQIRTICGDCIELMKQYEDKEFDLCLTDPPYNVNVSNTEVKITNDNMSSEDYKQFCIKWFTRSFTIFVLLFIVSI